MHSGTSQWKINNMTNLIHDPQKTPANGDGSSGLTPMGTPVNDLEDGTKTGAPEVDDPDMDDSQVTWSCPECTKNIASGGAYCDFCESWFHETCLDELFTKQISKVVNGCVFVLLKCCRCRHKEAKVTQEIATQTDDWASIMASQQDPVATNNLVNPINTGDSIDVGGGDDCFVDAVDDDVVVVEHEAAHTQKGVCTGDNEDDPVIVYGKQDPLSNLYEFDLLSHGRHYMSVEHGYHHLRALDEENHILANQIIHAQSGVHAKRLSRQLRVQTADRTGDVNRMRSLLQEKLKQCWVFRDSLRKSGKRKLVHSTYHTDKFWASGEHHSVKRFPNGFSGKNMHGVLLSEVRDGMHSEKEYDITSQRSGVAVKVTVAPMCFHCGVKGHIRRECRHRHRKIFCDKCGLPNHKKRYCTSGTRDAAVHSFSGNASPNYRQTGVELMAKRRVGILPLPARRWETTGPSAQQYANRGFGVNNNGSTNNFIGLNAGASPFIPSYDHVHSSHSCYDRSLCTAV